MPKGRRVRRVVRKIDTWTVLRLSFVFWLCVALIGLLASVLLWNVAGRLDVFSSISKFLESLGILDFKFHGGVILKAAAVVTIVGVLLATGASVLLAVLYNLISDVVGGIIVVFEERPRRRRLRVPRPNPPFDGDVPPPPLTPAKAERRRLARPLPRAGPADPLPPPSRPPVQPETVTPAELMRHQD